MATIKIEIVAGANTYSKTKTVSGADLVRLIDACKTHFGMPDATDADVADAWINALYSYTKGLVKGVEDAAAVKVAFEGVAEIDLS